MLRLTITLSTASLLLACAGSKGEPADNNAGDPTPAVEEPAVAPPADEAPADDGTADNPDGKDEAEAITGPTPAGDWVSASCGERTYERRLSFFDERRTYEGQDLVSPCPEGTQCVWSGVVTYNGRWWPTDDGLGLDELNRDGDQGVARPGSLTWADGKLVEGADCAYTVAAAP